MLSITEYVTSRGISQTAARRQIKRYSEELEGHIIISNRRKMLDDFAVEFLDSHRMQRAVVINNDNDLIRQIETLKAELETMKSELIHIQNRYISLRDEQAPLLEYKTKAEMLLLDQERNREELRKSQEDLKKSREELQESRGEIASLKADLEETRIEVNSFEKSIFGFYRKKK